MNPHRRFLFISRLLDPFAQLVLLVGQPLELGLRNLHVASLSATKAFAALPGTNMNLADPTMLVA